MISCKLCGHEFDELKAEPLECGCGCGSSKVMCPNCGYEVRLNTNIPRPKKDDNSSFFSKITKRFRMDSY